MLPPRPPLLPGALAALLVLAGCDAPIGAMRRSPPTGIEGRVVAARAKAPMFALDGTTGPFHLTEALAKDHVLLVFYRGHW